MMEYVESTAVLTEVQRRYNNEEVIEMLMQDLSPVFEVLGIGVIAHFSGIILENIGHGGKTMYVKIGASISCAYVAFDAWWDGVWMVARTFGVHL